MFDPKMDTLINDLLMVNIQAYYWGVFMSQFVNNV